MLGEINLKILVVAEVVLIFRIKTRIKTHTRDKYLRYGRQLMMCTMSTVVMLVLGQRNMV